MSNDDAGSMQQLFALITRLRGENGCPWDREQKLDDVLSDLIEEAYELEWAGTHHGPGELLDEMGDVLFLLCFALSIRRETDPEFTLARVATHAHDKIKGRHPHVFGRETASTPEESIVHWEKSKAAERAKRGEGALEGVAGNLPPLRHAVKILDRAGSTGFDWDEIPPVIEKLREEIAELEHALASGERAAIEDETGDVLFAAANVARFLKIDADEALQRSTSKFIRRFELMEGMIRADGRRFEDMTLDEMDVYWERAKSS
ncbi:MAG: nucleoside triphosphate pyrophosphohydrolase [Candidatus Krumholzibacteria bacterium]|nr:nucleoside triphosphate pyrophosphohydrolase [Candidatus Krumholzibacteria bacterium]MDH5627211.1 nucleoside triphosphate pyrophosphohydrolase [Candidatus Krumholzibacteria bacterium]